MKKLLIPVIIAVLAGVGGGSGFSYMQASKKYVADSTTLADSLKAHPEAKSDSAAAEGEVPAEHQDTAPVVEAPPMTPADSIRALEASRGALHEATKGVADAVPAKGEPKGEPKAEPAATKHEPAKAEPVKAVPTKTAPAKSGAKPSDSKTNSTASVADAVRDARNDALNTPLPEQRLAKIFTAMSAKDAAKVMEQMPDSDVRTILGLMNDKTAAAILTQFPPQRAAVITKGSARSTGTTP
jgi:hypothetical protein